MMTYCLGDLIAAAQQGNGEASSEAHAQAADTAERAVKRAERAVKRVEARKTTTCELCGKTFSRKSAARHLRSKGHKLAEVKLLA